MKAYERSDLYQLKKRMYNNEFFHILNICFQAEHCKLPWLQLTQNQSLQILSSLDSNLAGDIN
jgi:hypothetical protein